MQRIFRFIFLFLSYLLTINTIWASDMETEMWRQDTENLRIGSSFFYMGNYTKALRHLQHIKDRKLSSELEYASLLYLNRQQEAKSVFNDLPEEKKTEYIVSPKILSSLSVTCGILINKPKQATDEYATVLQQHFIPGSLFSVSASHDIGNKLSFHHTLLYHNTPGMQTFRHNGQETQKRIKYEHIAYTGNVYLVLPRQWNMTFSASFFPTKEQAFTIATEKPKKDYFDPYRMQEPPTVSMIPNKTKGNNYASEISIGKDIYSYRLYASCSYANIDKNDVFQPNIALVWLPWGNISDLYLEAIFSNIIYNKDLQIVWQTTAGKKIRDWLWIELSYCNGNMRYYNEKHLNNVLTMLNSTKYRIKGEFVFPISKHLSANISYHYIKKENNCQYQQDWFHIGEIKQTVNNHNITGGVKCIF